MPLSRKEYVAVCEICVKRKFDSKVGLLCSLTDKYADFNIKCPDYEQDELAIKRNERMQKHNDEAFDRSMSSGKGLGNEANMMKSGIGGGILMIIGGVVWLLIGLSFDWIFYYPFFLIIGGIIVIVKSINKKAKEFNKADTSDIIDDEFE